MSTIKSATIQGLASATPNILINNEGTISLGTSSVSKSTNGYLKLPDGMIIQWGITPTVAAGAEYTVTFPIAFPTAGISANIVRISTASTQTLYGWCIYSVPTQTQVVVTNGTASAETGYWFAIGY